MKLNKKRISMFNVIDVTDENFQQPNFTVVFVSSILVYNDGSTEACQSL